MKVDCPKQIGFIRNIHVKADVIVLPERKLAYLSIFCSNSLAIHLYRSRLFHVFCDHLNSFSLINSVSFLRCPRSIRSRQSDFRSNRRAARKMMEERGREKEKRGRSCTLCEKNQRAEFFCVMESKMCSDG